MVDKRQWCTFFLDQLFFGVEVESVQEIIRYQEMTPVPLAPTEVGGLINLRGEIVTAINLRHRLKLPPRDDGDHPLNVVARADGDTVSLLVDEIGDVLEVAEENFEPPPDTLTGRVRQFIQGAYKLESQLLLVLDLEKTVHLSK